MWGVGDAGNIKPILCFWKLKPQRGIYAHSWPPPKASGLLNAVQLLPVAPPWAMGEWKSQISVRGWSKVSCRTAYVEPGGALEVEAG